MWIIYFEGCRLLAADSQATPLTPWQLVRVELIRFYKKIILILISGRQDYWPSTTEVCWWRKKSHLCSALVSQKDSDVSSYSAFILSVFLSVSSRLVEIDQTLQYLYKLWVQCQALKPLSQKSSEALADRMDVLQVAFVVMSRIFMFKGKWRRWASEVYIV